MHWIRFEKYSSVDERKLRLMSIRVLYERNERSPFSRPERTGWVLQDEYHEWFVNMGIPYEIRYAMDGMQDNWWRIGIEDPNHALIVKLAWAK